MILFAAFICALPVVAHALPRIDLSIDGADATGPTQITNTIKILSVLTILSLAPAILMLMTCFTRIVIVFSFLRQALGVQGMPPNQVLMGLSLILTLFVMSPVGRKIYSEALGPYMENKVDGDTALKVGMAPLRRFMLDQTREKDLEFFLELSKEGNITKADDIPITVVVPSFVISELTTAFHMGFLIFIPFVLLDFVLASILMSMGMVMLPPALISMPLKVMLFVLVDGWHLVVESLVRSFQV